MSINSVITWLRLFKYLRTVPFMQLLIGTVQLAMGKHLLASQPRFHATHTTHTSFLSRSETQAHAHDNSRTLARSHARTHAHKNANTAQAKFRAHAYAHTFSNLQPQTHRTNNFILDHFRHHLGRLHTGESASVWWRNASVSNVRVYLLFALPLTVRCRLLRRNVPGWLLRVCVSTPHSLARKVFCASAYLHMYQHVHAGACTHASVRVSCVSDIFKSLIMEERSRKCTCYAGACVPPPPPPLPSPPHTGQSLLGAASIRILDSDRLLPAAQYVCCHLERCH